MKVENIDKAKVLLVQLDELEGKIKNHERWIGNLLSDDPCDVHLEIGCTGVSFFIEKDVAVQQMVKSKNNLLREQRLLLADFKPL